MSNETIPYIPLMMAHGDVSTAPCCSLPSGYSFRLFCKCDEQVWAAITASAGEFASRQEAAAYFNTHFIAHWDELTMRCLFLMNDAGESVGTATGWFMDDDVSVGRLHWVSIEKGHQGRGLCKPLVAEAMRRMALLGHTKAMLTTQPKSWKGIKVYSGLGWKPHNDGSTSFEEGWALVEELISNK